MGLFEIGIMQGELESEEEPFGIMKNCLVSRLMGHLSHLGRVSGNPSSGDSLLLPTWTLSLASGDQ